MLKDKILNELKYGFLMFSVFYAVITILLFDRIQLKNKVLSYFNGIVFVYVWLTGFIEPLHPDAYRDNFLNFTAISIFVMLVIFLKDNIKRRRNKNKV